MGTGKLLGENLTNCEGVTKPLHATETGIRSGSYEPFLAPSLHFQDDSIKFMVN